MENGIHQEGRLTGDTGVFADASSDDPSKRRQGAEAAMPGVANNLLVERGEVRDLNAQKSAVGTLQGDECHPHDTADPNSAAGVREAPGCLPQPGLDPAPSTRSPFFLSLFTACDIWTDRVGSDHAPVWVQMSVPHPWRPPADPPPLCTRHTFKGGKQSKLQQWLTHRPSVSKSNGDLEPRGEGQLQSIEGNMSVPSGIRAQTYSSQGIGKAKGSQAKGGSIQGTLMRFMSRQPTSQGDPASQGPGSSSRGTRPREDAQGLTEATEFWPSPGDALAVPQLERMKSDASGQSHAAGATETALKAKEAADPRDVRAAWGRIQAAMQPPRCKGHHEPCVIRTVKKKGENLGRQFYVCNRPDGPPPVGRCDFFMWANNRTVKGQTTGQVKKARLA